MKTFRTILAVLMFFGLFVVAAFAPFALASIDTIQDRSAITDSLKKSEILTKSEFVEQLLNEDATWDKSGLEENYEAWGIGDAVESATVKIVDVVYDWLESDKELNAEIDLTNEIEIIISASVDKQFKDIENSDLPVCTPEQDEALNKKLTDAYFYEADPMDIGEIECKPASLKETAELYKTYAKALFTANFFENPDGSTSIDSYDPNLVVSYESLEVSEDEANSVRNFYNGMETVKWIIIASFVLLTGFGIALMPDRKIGFYVAAGVIAFMLVSYLPTLFVTRGSFVIPPDPDPAVNVLMPFFEEYLYVIASNMKLYILMELVVVIGLIGGGVALGKSQQTNAQLIPQTPMDPKMEEKAFVKA